MFFSFAYLALRALLGLLVRSRRGPDSKDIELMVMRHELDVLRRKVERPTVRIVDRALWVSKFGARSRKMRICRWDPIFGTPHA